MTRLISPSKITAWLECPHTLTLRHRVDTKQLQVVQGGLGEMATMLMAKGQSHEDAVLARYRAAGKSICRVPERITPDNPAPADADGRTTHDYPGGWEPFAAWVERVGNPMADGWDVIYQLPMVHEGVRGVADFIVRVDATADAPEHYEAVDAKLARREAKPGHVLQLCFYADALEALTGHRGKHIHLELGSGVTETIRLAEVESYWRRMKGQLFRALDAAATADTVAEPCDHCNFCEFANHCDGEWRRDDSLVFVAGIRSADRSTPGRGRRRNDACPFRARRAGLAFVDRCDTSRSAGAPGRAPSAYSRPTGRRGATVRLARTRAERRRPGCTGTDRLGDAADA